MSSFDSTKSFLTEIINNISSGKIQLPEFQRGWIWDDEHVRSLLVSVARSFPVGAVMLLDTGGDLNFQIRPIENLEFKGPIPDPEKLILDGQQRLTTLTQVLALERPVKTFNEKRKAIERYYYIDINSALENPQLEDAFIAVETDKKIKKNFGRDVVRDLSSPQKECEEMYFPCNQILNSDKWEESLQEYTPNNFGLYMKFRKSILGAFRSYQIPIIALDKSTSKEAVCLVFEKVNTGGVPLSVFELVTASFAAENFNLRKDWFGDDGREQRIKKEPVLKKIEPTDFLQAIALLNTFEKRQLDIKNGKTGKSISAVSAKRLAILNLSFANYNSWADKLEEGFLQTAKFLKKECFYFEWDIPYSTQIIPLATILALLKERWREPKIYDKLSRWFWCGVFGELYRGAVETRIANDLEELLNWIENDGEEPRTVDEATFNSNRLYTLRSRLSAAYKGLNTLILKEGAVDFYWKATIEELERDEAGLDIHHIFPKAWCEQNKIKQNIYNSIINKTPISYKANRMIGKKAPSEYIPLVQNHKQVNLSDAEMDKTLESHFINSDLLREDNFDEFLKDRTQKLLKIIEKAMGKPVEMIDDNNDDYDEN